MDIRIGSRLLAEDGEWGKVERLILHPDTREIDGIVASTGGLLSYDVVVPIDSVASADEREVRVRGTRDDVSNLEPYAQSQYVLPPEDWVPPIGTPSAFFLMPASPLLVGALTPPAPHPPAPGSEVEDLHAGDVEVSGDTRVLCADGKEGRLDRVVTAGDTDRVTHLVIAGAGLHHGVAVPVEQIVAMDADAIRIGLTAAELRQLPEFRE